jgi:CelD/BcsL family acetyltransferase involved in cellulose biosynthesis
VLKVECLRSAHELDGLKSRWEWLESQGDYTLFQGYELNRLAADWFAQRECPHVIVAESGSGMAIIPAVRRETELGLIGETLFDYRDVLNIGNGEVLEEAWRELAKLGMKLEVTALRGKQACGRWDSLGPKEFCNAPTTRRCDLSAVEFVAGHKKAAKASRRLARQGLRLVQREHEFDRLAEWVYRRKTEWRGAGENLFLDRRRQDFMCHVINSGVVDCNIWSYETIDGQIVAVLVTFDHGSIRHFYTIHHDPLWEQFSPGQVMIFDVTRETLADGMDVDFMTGEYPYKNRLATALVPLFRVEASAHLMRFGDQPQMLKPAV